MLLSLVAVGTAVFTIFFTKTAVEMNRDEENEINKTRIKTENLFLETEALAKKSKKHYKNAINNLNRLKKNIYENTFTRFEETAKLLTNINFDHQIDKIKVSRSKIEVEQLVFHTEEVSSFLTDNSQLLSLAVCGGPLPLTHIFYGMKLDKIKAEADMEASEVLAQYEVVKKECSKTNSITRLLMTTHTTIKRLNELSSKAVNNLISIIDTNGTDYSLYSEKNKDSVFITFKIIDILNQLLNKEIINERGNIKAEFRKYIGETNTICLEYEEKIYNKEITA